jgi:hypothetical protein
MEGRCLAMRGVTGIAENRKGNRPPLRQTLCPMANVAEEQVQMLAIPSLSAEALPPQQLAFLFPKSVSVACKAVLPLDPPRTAQHPACRTTLRLT